MRISKGLFIFFVCVIFIFSSAAFYNVEAQTAYVPTVTSVVEANPTVVSDLPVTSVPKQARTQVAELAQERQKFKQEMMLKRQEASEQAKQKRADFQAKTQEIKDQRKKELVQRLDERISTINQNRTNKMIEILDRLQTILDKITQKTDEAKANGVDVTAVADAITSAQLAIDTAKNVISNQAGKEYVIVLNTTDDVSVKTNVGTTITQFKTDMADVQKKIVDAREAVIKAAQELSKAIVSAKTIGSGTPSGTIAQ